MFAIACSADDPVVQGTPPPSVSPPAVPASCTPIRSPQVIGKDHIEDGGKASYNSTPPTSGNHYRRPIAAGVYTEPVQNERQVHNLEHGHVLVQYRDLEAGQVAALEAIVRQDPRMMLMAPYPDMDPKVALTSWGKIQTCDAWSDQVSQLLRYFVHLNRDNAPESVL
ncbi:MAG: DUF3105 domain-containing protein [Actinomycetota bacterium]